jgi:predicted nucleotidyltransferase
LAIFGFEFLNAPVITATSIFLFGLKKASSFDWEGLVHDLKKLGVSVDVVPENSFKKELSPQVLKDLVEI